MKKKKRMIGRFWVLAWRPPRRRAADRSRAAPPAAPQIVCFNCLDLYHKTPISGELQCKAGELEKAK